MGDVFFHVFAIYLFVGMWFVRIFLFFCGEVVVVHILALLVFYNGDLFVGGCCSFLGLVAHAAASKIIQQPKEAALSRGAPSFLHM